MFIKQSRKSSIEQYNIFKEPENKLLKLELSQPISVPLSQSESQSNNYNNIKSESYFAMFEHIHNTPFNKLSSSLQTRHLQELFRFNIISTIQTRQKKGDNKQSDQGELLTILNTIYSSHKSGINFVQIGACDGNWKASNDPIQRFILQNQNWHGVMLEPVPYLFDTLATNIYKSIPDWTNRIVPINAALSDQQQQESEAFIG